MKFIKSTYYILKDYSSKTVFKEFIHIETGAVLIKAKNKAASLHFKLILRVAFNSRFFTGQHSTIKVEILVKLNGDISLTFENSWNFSAALLQ